MVSGEAPRKALARAAVDALLRCGRYQSLCESVKVLLQHEQERQHQSERVAAAMAHSTRVNFDIMPGA
jgi:alpha-D-ribose 1-methylphosphonate 5-triphosphate synthase subunit PhnG